MNVHELQNFDFDAPSRVQTASSYLTSSVRSSFDKDYLQSHRCDVSIRDEASLEAGTHRDDDVGANDLLDKYMILGNPNSAALPTNLKSKLASRDPSRTRWINVVGWSEALMDQLARLYLDDHGCLDLPEVSEQVLGGPIKRKDSGDFVWIQSTIWFRGGRNPSWSSLQQSGFRMVICMPTPTQAGTLITNFVGRAALANEISRICTENLLDAHAMGTHALGCVWILAFSLLKSIAEQMDFAFEIFDPTAATHSGMPRMDELPYMLQQANNLAKMDRYISALDEFSSFFVSVRSFQQRTRGVVLLETSSEPASRETDRRHNIAERATLESCLAQQRIVRARKLCSTYMRQYESLVQMVISYSTTQITERLDSGRTIAEKFATIGIVLAGISGLTAPLTILTSYFGMNVQELVSGATYTLFDFWQIALPTLLASFIGLGFVVIRLLSKQSGQ